MNDRSDPRHPDSQNPARHWFLLQNGERFGPYDDRELLQHAVGGLIARDSLLWTEGMPEWIRAEAVEGLFPEAPSPVPNPVHPTHRPAVLSHVQEQIEKAKLIQEASKLHKASYGSTFAVAGLNLVMGTLAEAAGIKLIRMFSVPSLAIGAGVIYLVLGILVACRSRVALAITLVIFVLDTAVIFYGYAMAGHMPLMTALCRISLVAFMARGFEGIGKLDELQRR